MTLKLVPPTPEAAKPSDPTTPLVFYFKNAMAEIRSVTMRGAIAICEEYAKADGSAAQCAQALRDMEDRSAVGDRESNAAGTEST